MSDNGERAGLGKVIYDHDEKKKDAAEKAEALEDAEDVEEADVESFPASDPPSFAGGSSDNERAGKQ